MVCLNSMETPPTSIKLLAIDIDGTLLNPEGEITPTTLASVQAAREAGIVVTLATARRYCNTARIATEIGLAGPLILYDGALIVQHPQGSILSTRPLQAGIAQQAVEILVLDNLWLDAYFATYPEQMRRMPYETLCAGHPDPLRVVAFASEESIQGVIPEVSTLKCSWTMLKRGSFGSAELAIMDYGCSKASGVAALAQARNISLSEVMAIGDNNNDIAMLQSVGWGVAMGQAPEQVKSAAHVVTASNWEDGVAQAIARYALSSARLASSNSFNRATCL